LCQTYWHPVYTFVRRSGYPPDQPYLVQGFFTVLLEKNYGVMPTRNGADSVPF
jgi:hypothetical protein